MLLQSGIKYNEVKFYNLKKLREAHILYMRLERV